MIVAQKRGRLIWSLLLLVSVGWMAAGAFLTSDAFQDGAVGADLSAEIQTLADGISLETAPDLPLSLLFFLVTGAPVALVSLLMLWRGRRAGGERAPLGMRRQTILVTLLALIFALFLWNLRDVQNIFGGGNGLGVSIITYPARLFVTFIHEAGHSLAALITGGQVHGFTVSPDGSGLAVTAGGNPALILPAGYLGAALFGSALFFLANRMPRWTRALSGILGVAIIALTLAYAMPDSGGSPTALVIGIGFGVGMIGMGWQASRLVNLFVLNTLAILTGLHAVMDLWSLMRNPGAGGGGIMNDAAAFSQQFTPFFSTAVVAALWAASAVVMLLAAMYFGLVKPAGGEIAEAVKSKA